MANQNTWILDSTVPLTPWGYLGFGQARLFTSVDVFLHQLNEVVGQVINWFTTSFQG